MRLAQSFISHSRALSAAVGGGAMSVLHNVFIPGTQAEDSLLWDMPGSWLQEEEPAPIWGYLFKGLLSWGSAHVSLARASHMGKQGVSRVNTSSLPGVPPTSPQWQNN